MLQDLDHTLDIALRFGQRIGPVLKGTALRDPVRSTGDQPFLFYESRLFGLERARKRALSAGRVTAWRGRKALLSFTLLPIEPKQLHVGHIRTHEAVIRRDHTDGIGDRIKRLRPLGARLLDLTEQRLTLGGGHFQLSYMVGERVTDDDSSNGVLNLRQRGARSCRSAAPLLRNGPPEKQERGR